MFYISFNYILTLFYNNIQKMITGKIYRNKPIDIQQNFYQTEYQQPLRRVMSNNQLLQSCPSMDINFNQQIVDDRDRQWGGAKDYVEKCERRMRERVAAIQRRYNSSLQQLQKTLEEKDLVIKALKEALQDKQKTIQSLRKDNQQVLSSSRLMLSSSRR